LRLEIAPLLEPIFAHYAAQWPKIMKGLEEDEFGRGFYLDGQDLPEQIADPSRADELDAIAWRNIPPETRREWERGPTTVRGSGPCRRGRKGP
jgi:hypothetical protein